ncbi:T6SS immunity protein Tdi1 domain-containing protein [Catellatospora chokoriensis]|uniref:T6SS immunity protein Tdi1 C-terminal domain-containing protein n=1 Tax=Catellatospora chokoriensis TaxID=310353 RepID=A0A8J3JLV6_9ACTN|nr:T6SS immunity protein Tdi1 domain-containing protein [Catellatospora chokoriensis]GIF87396.1 hypothetical protein Cch02nite_08400 [Catellatospora chokoriensis]
MRFTKTFTEQQYAQALDSWSWLGLDGRKPLFTSLFGDVFLAGKDGCWYLDTIEGALTRVWASADELALDLSTEQGQDRYLLGGLAAQAADRGLELGSDQVYTFMPPPVIGGGVTIESVVVESFAVAVNIAGQIHEQVRDLPPGTSVTGITLG